MGEQGKPILEVIVRSVEDAVAADRGGASRLEIISHYEAGGLTPAFDLVQEITSTVKIPAVFRLTGLRARRIRLLWMDYRLRISEPEFSTESTIFPPR